MTSEEAILILNPATSKDALMERMGGVWNQTQALALIGEAQEIGLSALRAQQTPAKLDKSRWEGCPNCHRWQTYGYENYKPAYCRDCGKPLNEQAWADFARKIGGNDGTTD